MFTQICTSEVTWSLGGGPCTGPYLELRAGSEDVPLLERTCEISVELLA